MNLPYKYLSLFVAGTLSSVFVLVIITENYLSSSGFEHHRHIFHCLVDELEARNVTDDYFPSSLHDDTSDVNCSEILEQFHVLEDMREDLHVSYNVTLNLCTKIASDKELELCDAEGTGNQSKSRSNGTAAESCVDMKEYLSDEDETHAALVERFKQSKVNCENLDSCFDCIEERLKGRGGDYETAVLHAIAVNFTVIEFQVWNYFRISSRVHELVTEANRLARSAADDCWVRQECVAVGESWRAT